MNVSWTESRCILFSLHWTVSHRFIDHTTTVFIPVECIRGILYSTPLYPISLHHTLYPSHEQTIVSTVSTESYLTAPCIVSEAWSDHKGFDVGGQEAHHLPTTTNQTLAPKESYQFRSFTILHFHMEGHHHQHHQTLTPKESYQFIVYTV